MNDFEATMIAEGITEPEGEDDTERQAHYVAAWQHLIDTGLAWQLQGWYGRSARAMIENGYCEERS